jgi:hypothetical protein
MDSIGFQNPDGLQQESRGECKDLVFCVKCSVRWTSTRLKRDLRAEKRYSVLSAQSSGSPPDFRGTQGKKRGILCYMLSPVLHSNILCHLYHILEVNHQ